MNGISNRLDQVSSHPLYFNLNGLNSNFRPQVFSIRGRNMETRAYTGGKSLGRVYDPIYVDKVNPSHVYADLYANVTRLSHVQVCEQHF